MPFSDDELDRYYRDIEARTAAVRPSVPNRDAGGARPVNNARGCPTPDKKPYRSAVDARDTIRHIQTVRSDVPPLNAYQCGCGAWHITSRPTPVTIPTRIRRKGAR